jgi:hypothetical protein
MIPGAAARTLDSRCGSRIGDSRRMGEHTGFDYAYARFRQRLMTRPTRDKLGITITQEEALRLLADEAALRALYAAWVAEQPSA